MDVTKAERKRFDEIRGIRNRIAHGARPVLTVHEAVKMSTDLRQWGARIDKHMVDYFFVSEQRLI